MRIYRSCPTQKNAKDAWRYFVNKNKEEPRSMWKMPNNFKKEFSVEAKWGLWLAQYDGWLDYLNPKNKKDSAPVARNVFSFIKKQTIIEKIMSRIS